MRSGVSEAPAARPAIFTVTANAAIDRTLELERLEPGRRCEVLREHAQAGGKGVNVARVLRALGFAVRTLVVVGGEAGAWILRDLERAGIDAVAVEVAGESRTCLELVEAPSARVTQLHGPGARACPADADRLLAALELGPRPSWVAICGSFARGFPADTAARLVEAARVRGAWVALDTSGAALAAGWRARPDLLRVTRSELREALERGDLSPHEWMRTGGPLRLGVVSDGAGPVIAWEPGRTAWRSLPPPVRLRNPIGCGDAMLAGLLAALAEGRSSSEALRRAIALAAADAESPFAGRTPLARASELLDRVRLKPLGPPRPERLARWLFAPSSGR